MSEYLLEMRNITKEFPGVRALENVTFQSREGEIHALVGESGAGKSTLMKILSGFYPYGTYTGDIVLEGQVQKFDRVRDSEHAGIAIIYQELALVKQMTIAENIFLGSELCKGKGIINWNETFQRTAKALKEVGLKLSPASRIIDLGVGSQQLVEIAKALTKEARVLILDEPTAALTETEADNLLKILDSFRAQGVSCIYISHRLKEVARIADRITVLRDGRTVVTDAKTAMPEDRMIQNMVGRPLTNMFPRRPRVLGETVLEVKNWTVQNPLTNDVAVNDVSFEVRKGEIVGIAGLMGAGRTELVMSLFGVWGKKKSGEVRLGGKPIEIHGARDAIRAGLSLVSEDRKRYGLILGMDVKENSTLASLQRISKLGIINKNEEIKWSDKYVKELRTKTPNLEQRVGNLSGGNQQKVVLAKWLLTQPKVLILDEPTRGIDVGAKVEIYNIMNDLVDDGDPRHRHGARDRGRPHRSLGRVRPRVRGRDLRAVHDQVGMGRDRFGHGHAGDRAGGRGLARVLDRVPEGPGVHRYARIDARVSRPDHRGPRRSNAGAGDGIGGDGGLVQGDRPGLPPHPHPGDRRPGPRHQPVLHDCDDRRLHRRRPAPAGSARQVRLPRRPLLRRGPPARVRLGADGRLRDDHGDLSRDPLGGDLRARPDRHLRLRRQGHDLRQTPLRHRRQPGRREAVGHQRAASRVRALHDHGADDRDRGHRLHFPPQRRHHLRP